ncbi:hypothetical protein GDO81_027050, partial [Engystomops pustulosus]
QVLWEDSGEIRGARCGHAGRHTGERGRTGRDLRREDLGGAEEDPGGKPRPSPDPPDLPAGGGAAHRWVDHRPRPVWGSLPVSSMLDLLPGLPEKGNLEEFSRVCSQAGHLSPRPMTLLSALFSHPDGVQNLDLRLKISREEKALALFLLKERKTLTADLSEQEPLKPFQDYVIDSRETDAHRKVCELLKYQGEERLLAQMERWTLPRFPVSGHDLRRMGISSGKEIGRILQELRERWKESGYQAGKEELLNTVSRSEAAE